MGKPFSMPGINSGSIPGQTSVPKRYVRPRFQPINLYLETPNIWERMVKAPSLILQLDKALQSPDIVRLNLAQLDESVARSSPKPAV